MLHQIKAPLFFTDLGLQKTVLNPLANGKIKGLFNAFECFQVLFKANFIFKDVSRQSCIFKFFSSLCEISNNVVCATSKASDQPFPTRI